MLTIYIAIAAVLSLVVGAGAGYAFRKSQAKKSADHAEARAEQMLSEAKKKQEEVLTETKNKEQEALLRAKEKAMKIIEEAKQDETVRRRDIQDQ